MQENVVLLLRIVEFMPFGPVVTDSVGEDLTVVVEAASSNRLFHLLRGLEFESCVELSFVNFLSHCLFSNESLNKRYNIADFPNLQCAVRGSAIKKYYTMTLHKR